MNKVFTLSLIWAWLLRVGALSSRDVKILPPLKAMNGRAGFRPHHARTIEVISALAVAPDKAQYKELIEHVRAATGTGCSRRIVARWKKQKLAS